MIRGNFIYRGYNCNFKKINIKMVRAIISVSLT